MPGPSVNLPVTRALGRAAATVVVLAAVSAVSAQAAPAPPGEIVVGASSTRTAVAIAAELRAEGLVVTPIARIDSMSVAGDGLDAVGRRLSHDSRVEWVEPPRDRTLSIALPPLADLETAVDALTARSFNWAVESVGVGDAATLAPNATPVSVAVVDSGLDVKHPDLAGRIGTPINVVPGTGIGDVSDLVGHGTFVAGLIAGISGNGIGGRGVAGSTAVIPIRVTTTGKITSADAAAGIVRAVDAGARVINLSFGGPVLSDVERAALDYADAKDVLVVAAAGNNAQETDPAKRNLPQYPAAAIGGVSGSWGSGLSVAATTPTGARAAFSTMNDSVSIAAPGAGSGQCGDGVFSTLPANATTLWDPTSTLSCNRVLDGLADGAGRYGYSQGTSFSTPLVSGAAALVRDVNPALTADQTADVLRRSAHHAPGGAWNAMVGAGVLDVDSAIALAGVYDTSPPAPSLSALTTPGAVAVTLAARDAAQGSQPATGVATYRLERSGDGVTYSAAVETQNAEIHLGEGLAPTESRWYRGTVCDVNHNCATAVAGPVKGAVAPAPAPSRVQARTAAAVVKALSVVRPHRCRACVRVVFGGSGAGPRTWSVILASRRAGVRTVRRTGALPEGSRPITLLLPLSKLPNCGGHVQVTIRLTSAGGTTTASRSLAVGARCARATRA